MFLCISLRRKNYICVPYFCSYALGSDIALSISAVMEVSWLTCQHQVQVRQIPVYCLPWFIQGELLQLFGNRKCLLFFHQPVTIGSSFICSSSSFFTTGNDERSELPAPTANTYSLFSQSPWPLGITSSQSADASSMYAVIYCVYLSTWLRVNWLWFRPYSWNKVFSRWHYRAECGLCIGFWRSLKQFAEDHNTVHFSYK